jgi:hypothetical protein
VFTASPGPRSRLASHHPEGHGREWWRLGTLDFSTATGRDFWERVQQKQTTLGNLWSFLLFLNLWFLALYIYLIYLFITISRCSIYDFRNNAGVPSNGMMG